MRSNRALLISLVATLAALACGQSVVGTWKGKIVPSKATLDKLKSEPKAMKAFQDTMNSTAIRLILNGDKSFQLSFTGRDAKSATPSSHTAEGTWSQAGAKIVLKTAKEDGKAHKRPDQPITVSKDGKSLTMVPSGKGAAMGKIVFTK